MTHTSRLAEIRQLACDVAGMASHTDGAPGAVRKVRKFWQEEFSSEGAAGREWRALVDLAHVNTPHMAAAAWGDVVGAAQDPGDYKATMAQLQNRLEVLVCPC